MSDAGDVVALQDGEARAMGDGVFVVPECSLFTYTYTLMNLMCALDN